jgi:hypothetical protein
MTTSVDSLGLMIYLCVATLYLSFSGSGEPSCHMSFPGRCVPSNPSTQSCTLSLPSFQCIAAS